MKFKTVVGRVAYSDDFDKLMEKTIAELGDAQIQEVKLATSDRIVIAVIVYLELAVPEEVKPKAKAKSGKGKTTTA